jgi:GTPase SAR1 family protein
MEAGQEQYIPLTKMYSKSGGCAILFYEITDERSLKSVQTYSDLFDQFSGREYFKILVGTKLGLKNGILKNLNRFGDGESRNEKSGN